MTSLLLPVGVEIFLLLLFSLLWSMTDPSDSFSWPQVFLEEGKVSFRPIRLVSRFQTQLHSLSAPQVGSLRLPSFWWDAKSVIFATYLAIVVFNNRTGAVLMEVYQ